MSKSRLIDAAVKAGLGDSEADFQLSGDRLTNSKTGKQYIAKAGDKQTYGEGLGLQRIGEASPGLAPKIYAVEQTSEGGWFISDYISLGSRSESKSLKRLAEKMATELHNPEKYPGITKFGFNVPTHCGATEQDNTWEDDWMVFFRDRRLGGILRQIESKRGSSAGDILKLGKQVQEKVCPALLSNFDPPPTPLLLHGDLWSGNVANNGETGEPVVFDCSVYYGHGEADFGISHMFSTFDDSFYETYHAILPKSQPDYDKRMKLYELYHHLNHYYLFGGSYGSGATRIMESLLAWQAKI